jgi:hypothetical protein
MDYAEADLTPITLLVLAEADQAALGVQKTSRKKHMKHTPEVLTLILFYSS